MDITNLILVIAIPFTPAFLINIAAAIANIDKKKFIKRTEANEIDMIMIMYFLNIFCI